MTNCRGDVQHGTGCNLCGKCLAELARLKRMAKPDVTEKDLDRREKIAMDGEDREIIRLARVGLWAELHSVEIDDALRIAGRSLHPLRRRALEAAITTRPRK